MKVQHHINPEQRWPRCQAVTLNDGILHCSLALQQTYVLTEAYRHDLHIRFANTKTDHDLTEFIRLWGPLDLSEGQKLSAAASFPLSNFRTFQRWLRAVLDLLAAFKSGEGERTALQEFLEADYEKERSSSAPLAEPRGDTAG